MARLIMFAGISALFCIGSPWMIAALTALRLYGIRGVTQKRSRNQISNELSTIGCLVKSGIEMTYEGIATETAIEEVEIGSTASALQLGTESQVKS